MTAASHLAEGRIALLLLLRGVA